MPFSFCTSYCKDCSTFEFTTTIISYCTDKVYSAYDCIWTKVCDNTRAFCSCLICSSLPRFPSSLSYLSSLNFHKRMSEFWADRDPIPEPNVRDVHTRTERSLKHGLRGWPSVQEQVETFGLLEARWWNHYEKKNNTTTRNMRINSNGYNALSRHSQNTRMFKGMQRL